MAVSYLVTIEDKGVKLMLDRAIFAISKDSITKWFYLHADPHMKDSFRKNFETSKAPAGDAWKAWSKAYLDHGSNLLRKTGGLMRSVTTKRGEIGVMYNNISMTWGGNIDNKKYVIHQLGTNKAGKNRDVKIPARPMIGFKNSDRIYLTQSLSGWFGQQMRGK